MELVASLAVLYLWQCTLRVPPVVRLFLKPITRWREIRGGGRRILHCRPSATSLVASTEPVEPARSASPRQLRLRWERLSRDTRLLGGCCDLYALLLFAGLPLLIALLTEERALLWALPLVIVVHLITLFAFYGAHRRLRPELSGERWEALVVAALYPPILLRSRQDLVREELAGFHPMAVRAALVEREVLVERMQQGLAALEHARSTQAETPAELERQRAALWAVARECGLSAGELAAARIRDDESARSYCAICLSDYRSGFDLCGECGVRTTPYLEEAARVASTEGERDAVAGGAMRDITPGGFPAALEVREQVPTSEGGCE